MVSHRAAHVRRWDRVQRRPRSPGRASSPLHPALARLPSDRSTGAAVEDRFNVFLRQRARPFLQALFGEIDAFRMRILQRTSKLLAAAAIKLSAHCARNESAAILLVPINVSDEVV